MKYPRKYITPEGKPSLQWLKECTCKTRRGPEGGVCGSCGRAILNEMEIENQ